LTDPGAAAPDFPPPVRMDFGARVLVVHPPSKVWGMESAESVRASWSVEESSRPRCHRRSLTRSEELDASTRSGECASLPTVWTHRVAAVYSGDWLRQAADGLKRPQVDQLDVLCIHEMLGPDDSARVEAKDGALEGLYTLRGQKMVRFVGTSCHGNSDSLAQALKRHEFDKV
jgi:hypothetical protein